MEKLTTEELLKRLRSTRTIEELGNYTSDLSGQQTWKSFSEYILAFLMKEGKTESEVIRDSQIPRTYAYQILNGYKNPGRDKVLALCLALRMGYSDAQRALALAGVGELYPRRKKDSILIFALEKELSVQQTNELLFEEGEEILN